MLGPNQNDKMLMTKAMCLWKVRHVEEVRHNFTMEVRFSAGLCRGAPSESRIVGSIADERCLWIGFFDSLPRDIVPMSSNLELSMVGAGL